MEEEKSEYVYKYLSFEQFVDLIEMQRLYLTNITQWEDCYEGYEIEQFQMYCLKKQASEYWGGEFKMSEKVKLALIDSKKQSYYAQSWTYSSNESDAMWRIYSQQKNGVRIKVARNVIYEKLKELENSSELYCSVKDGKVEYDKPIDYESYRDEEEKDRPYRSDKMPLLYRKRKAFKHEDEYRFTMIYNVWEDKEFTKVFFDTNNSISPGKCNSTALRDYNYPKVIYYHLPRNLIEQVVLDPRAPKYFEETFMKYCENRGLKKGIYKKSDLYTLKSVSC